MTTQASWVQQTEFENKMVKISFSRLFVAAFIALASAAPASTEAQCDRRRANLLNFMNTFTSKHGEIHDAKQDEHCVYDIATEWCWNFCGYHNMIEGDAMYNGVVSVINQYRDDPVCCPPEDIPLYEEIHEAEGTDYNIK